MPVYIITCTAPRTLLSKPSEESSFPAWQAMKHADTIALRIARKCLQLSTCQKSPFVVSRVWHPSPLPSLKQRNLHGSIALNRSPRIPLQQRHIELRRCFHASHAAQKLKPYGVEKTETGLKFQDDDLDDEQISAIFGPQAPPPEIATWLLRVLHGRRTDGTLDIPLPKEIEPEMHEYPRAIEDGLQYLRQQFPIDEDEAIMSRVAREEDPREKEHPSVLMQRGVDLGLFKLDTGPREPYYGPQSGYYQSDLSEKEDDPYGKSELDRMRAENDAKHAKEEEELQAQIDEEMAKAQKLQDDRSTAIAQRPEQSLETANELRPPNSVERWVLRARNRAQSKLTLESPEIAQMSSFRRLLPSFLLAASLCVGCYFFAQLWTRPKQSDRFFPGVSLSYATIGGLMAINTAVWLLWKLPPSWSILNKYFLFVPAYPYALSNLGNIFSHQKVWHLSMNMLALGIFGLPLHEEIGRGNFLAIYLASGLIGGFASFARHVVQGTMTTTVLGASGCVYGVLSAYLALHTRDQFTLFFIPQQYMDTISMSGSTVWVLIAVSQLFGVVARLGKVDYLDHLVGMIVGFFSARWWEKNGQKKEVPREKVKLGSWWDSVLGKGR